MYSVNKPGCLEVLGIARVGRLWMTQLEESEGAVQSYFDFLLV